MLIPVFSLFAAAGVLAALYRLAAAGFRNGDRPGDALVAAVPAPQAVVIRNPSGTPVLVGLTVRTALLPGWLVTPHDVSVPWWTLRGKFDPERFDRVGVVPAGGAAGFPAPARARARRTVLTVVVGQEGGRLRVHRLRLGPAGFPAEGRATIMVA